MKNKEQRWGIFTVLGRIMVVNDTWDRVEALKPFEIFRSPLVLFFGFFCFVCFWFCFWLCWVFTAAQAFPLIAVSGSYSLVALHGLLTAVSSLVTEHELYGMWASAGAARGLRGCRLEALEHRLSSCGARASLFCGMWDLPRPGRFFTADASAKPPARLVLNTRQCIDPILG